MGFSVFEVIDPLYRITMSCSTMSCVVVVSWAVGVSIIIGTIGWRAMSVARE